MKFLQHCTSINTRYKEIIEKYSQVFVVSDIASPSDNTINSINNYVSYDKFKILSNFGKQLSIFKTIVKTDVILILNRFYFIDALLGIVKLKNNLQLCLPKFINHTSQSINIRDLWHPCLEQSKCVKNDINMSNLILTGPNAGGKSTFIKALGLNVYMAQTIGVCSSSSIEFQPFYFMNTQINIPDCKGQESLFEAEMNRCMYNLETIEICQEHPSIVIMDEIFNSTNIVEAVSGAYSILEKMASYKNCLTVITTHFSYLTKLKKQNLFDCYRMNVVYDENNQILYPYKIDKGVSKQYVALELLKNRGFGKNIIDRAVEIKTRFVKN